MIFKQSSHCFDTVGWKTGRAHRLLASTILKGSSWENFVLVMPNQDYLWEMGQLYWNWLWSQQQQQKWSHINKWNVWPGSEQQPVWEQVLELLAGAEGLCHAACWASHWHHTQTGQSVATEVSLLTVLTGDCPHLMSVLHSDASCWPRHQHWLTLLSLVWHNSLTADDIQWRSQLQSDEHQCPTLSAERSHMHTHTHIPRHSSEFRVPTSRQQII